MLVLSLLLGTLSAQAQDCDAKALMAELNAATPVQAAEAFNKLAACDKAIATKAAKETVPRLVPGTDAYQAAVTSVKLGVAPPVVAWMGTIQPDERARAVKVMGAACEDPKVAEFFVERAKTLGDEFWEGRWYTALASCRVQSVQDVLWAELDKGVGDNRGRFFGVLEIFARSQGPNAIPKLKALLPKMTDDEGQVNVISAFADAARVGSVDGIDAKSAQMATATIVEVAPTLSSKAVEQARITLQALGSEAESDKLAAVRYKDVKQKDGRFLWGTVVFEAGTCKNSKAFQRIHVAPVSDPGNTWPDQLHDKVEASVKAAWELDMATRCKGKGAISVKVSSEPFKDRAALKAWTEKVVDEGKNPDLKNPSVTDHETIEL